MNIEKYIDEFSKEIKRKGYRQNSIEGYVSSVKSFLYHFESMANKPTEINEKNIKEYLQK